MEPTTIIIIISAALAISEALSLVPGVRANGIFQLVFNMLKVLAGSGKK